jgi:hypothetical protein
MHLIQKWWISFLRVRARRLAIGLCDVCPIWNHLVQRALNATPVYLRGCSKHIKPTRKFEIGFIWTDRAKRHNGIINSVAANKTHLTLSALSWSESARAPYLAAVKSHLLIRIRRAAETEPQRVRAEWEMDASLLFGVSKPNVVLIALFIFIRSLFFTPLQGENISATLCTPVSHLCNSLISFNLPRWFIVCLQRQCQLF